MDLPMVCNSPARLLLFMLTCVCVFCGSTERNLRENESIEKGTNLTERSSRLPHERFRRDSNEVKQCSDSRCFGNTTTFYTDPAGCYCDEACYKIFSDCCPDYEKQCGRQELLQDKSSLWKCVEMNMTNWGCYVPGTVGVWMISKCPANWPSDKLRTKCENVLQFSYPLEDFIPVVAAKGETYRNKHCALCNGVDNYAAWKFEGSTPIIPPEEFDLASKLKFIEDNGGRIVLQPKLDQPQRLCFGRNFINKCNLTNDPSYRACVEGPVEVVFNRRGGIYFKNSACATCNGYFDISSFGVVPLCAGSSTHLPFSIIFDPKEETSGILTIIDCPPGTVYDYVLKFCREGWYVPHRGKLTNEFLILLWFTHRGSGIIESYSKLESNLKSALITQCWLRGYQISKMAFHLQYTQKLLHVATFRLTLTPFQSLIMANQHNSNFNVTHENIAFWELFHFTKSFTLSYKGDSFFVRKVLSKRLSCYDGIRLHSDEYKTDENGSFVVNKTGKSFSLEDYTVVKGEAGNITLCRKLVLSDCPQGAYVPLKQSEYLVFPNLTVYHNATGSVFDFGEYLLSENKNTSNIPSATQSSPFSSNLTISVCLPFKRYFTKTETIHITGKTSYALEILTLVGFSVSIICLILLLITYGLFKELRAVPGLNLMNLSSSMLLSHLIWLIGTGHFTGTTACKGFAILEHYLFQVSFLAMSVISYHSCYVFSQPFAGRVANKSYRRFIKYSAFVWLTPAIFVAICVALDETGAFLVDYGTNCWMGNVDAKLYLFLLPLALLLLYNILTFIRTAASLHRHDKNREMLQRKEGKRNLLICTKLATLVGFPWLFAFIGVMFPDEEALEYLFVVFACLQGLYIGMAFLFNKKTLKLYKDRWNLIFIKRTPTYTSAPTFEMT